MLKAVIFDVDGVLVDSKEANIAFFQSILKQAGYTDVSRESILECFHLTLWQSLEKLTGSSDQAEIQKIWDSAHDPSHRNSDLFEFPEKLEQVLEVLHEDFKLAIVTSRIKVGIDDLFKAKELQHLFDVVVTFEDYDNPKPHPEPLMVALEKLHLDAKEAVYIGDSDSDIEAAESAGMPSIHLSTKKHANATHGVERFEELLDVVSLLSGEV